MIHYLFLPIILLIYCIAIVTFDTILVGKEFKMKKVVLWILLVIIMAGIFFLSACNTQVIDTNWKFDRAIISLPNGEIVEGKVDSWRDFEDGDQLQVKINGVTYLTHSVNVVLIDEP